mmetsp:Transcript_16779/g.41306  ORF Transcript_16779/g.41306 Transcript_16779/m.41306 type:complete len:364 (-) Transcript_16779:199-1290(-)
MSSFSEDHHPKNGSHIKEKDTKIITDEDAKQSFLGPVIATKRNVSEPIVYRRAVFNQKDIISYAPGHGPSMSRAFTDSAQLPYTDPRLVMHPSASSSSDVPSLPVEINRNSLIEFSSVKAKEIMFRLKDRLEKDGCTIISKKHQIEGKVLDGTKIFEFCAVLYSLNQKCSNSGGGGLGLWMNLLSGDRLSWLRFVCKLAQDLDGKVDANMKEFATEHYSLPKLDDFSGQRFIPDKESIVSCSAMVSSGFIENQLMGVEGLVEAGKHCAPNDNLAKVLLIPIADALTETSISKNLKVLRASSDLLSVAADLFQGDEKASSLLEPAVKELALAIGELTNRDVEVIHIEKSIKEASEKLGKVSGTK